MPIEELCIMAQLLRKLRDSRGLTYKSAAKKIGKTIGWWCSRELGIVKVNSFDISLITRGFRVEWRCVDGEHRILNAKGEVVATAQLLDGDV